MDLVIRIVAPHSLLPTPSHGWQGAATGKYIHTNDTPWYSVPRPWMWHRCRPHSVGVSGPGYLRYVYLRCACGAALRARLLRGWEPGSTLVWKEGAKWLQRNSRLWGHESFMTLM